MIRSENLASDTLEKFPTPLDAFKQGQQIQKSIHADDISSSDGLIVNEDSLYVFWEDKCDYSAPLPYEKIDKLNNRKALRRLFQRYDYDNSNCLTPRELQDLLTDQFKAHTRQFHRSTIRMMYHFFHIGLKKELSFKQFVKLWHYLKDWHLIYIQADINNSNSIDYKEYIVALKQTFGEQDFNQYFLNNLNLVTINFKAFCNKHRSLSFDSFVESVVWLIRVINCFRANSDHDLEATFSLKDFLICGLSLRY